MIVNHNAPARTLRGAKINLLARFIYPLRNLIIIIVIIVIAVIVVVFVIISTAVCRNSHDILFCEPESERESERERSRMTGELKSARRCVGKWKNDTCATRVSFAMYNACDVIRGS